MKIILNKDVKKQGKKGDILEVKAGYGKFLIHNKSAVLATDNSLNRLDKENKQKELEELKLIEECEKVKNNLQKEKLNFKVKTGAKDRVFGSISSKQIVDELKNKGYNIDKKQIKLDNILSSLGTYDILIELHKKVSAKIKVELTK